jgi:hypothetical protein
MRHLTYLVGAAMVAVALVGCAAASMSPAAPTQAPAASPAIQAPSNGQRVSGAVASVNQGTVTLASGQSFTTTAQTRVTRLQPITAADLQANQYVAITAKLQSDNTLMASAINVFDESMRGLAPGQRPMDGGNLMTNATIDQIQQVNGDTFNVSWQGGSATVKIAPDAKLNRIVLGQVSDITQGANISASVVNGVAQMISLQ